MAAQVQHTQSQGNGEVAGNSSMMRITAGPTALASKMIYQMLSMYLTILKSQSEQKNNFYQSQLSEAQGQAKATVNAATMQALGLACSGLTMIAGAIGSAVVNNKVGKEDYDANAGKMDDLEGQIKPLKEINNMQPEAAETGIGSGDAPSEDIQARIDQLKQGEFVREDGSYDQETTEAAIQHMKTTDPEGLADTKRTLDKQITQRSLDMNSYAQKLQQITTNRTVASQMATQGAQALGQGGQAAFKVAEANEQKDVELNRTAGSMAGQGASELGQDMGKQYQNAMQALQALAAIRQSSETSNM
jgi:hypothetical protein